MAKNIITANPYTVTGVKPGQWFLDSSEDFSTLTEPGYLSSVANAGIDFQPNDFIFAQYNNGANVGLFNVIESAPGVFSLEVYSPNSNSFIFENMQFVAKGGSDLNPGTTIGLPKLTIQAAIDALSLSPSNPGAVWVLDDNEYDENLVLPFNVQLYAPMASVSCTTGDLITVNDTGSNTVATITCAALNNYGTGLCINLLGSQSNIFLNTKIAQGDMHIEGGMVNSLIAQIDSEVHVTATGVLGVQIVNAILFTLTTDEGATVVGDVGAIIGPGVSLTNSYGNRAFVNKLTFQTDPITIDAGRFLQSEDGSTRIVYNNAADGNFTLLPSGDLNLPIGTNIEFTQLGLGAIVFVAGLGVTIVSPEGATVQTSGTGAYAKAWKYSDTIWILSGDLAPVA